MTMPSTHMVTPMIEDWSHRPKSGPKSIPSRVVSSSASISGVMSVEPWMSPPAWAITDCDTSNTAITILKVLDRIRMAQAVLNIHL